MLSEFILLSTILSNIAASAASTVCNPLSATTCSPNPALGTSISQDFTEESSYFSPYQKENRISYTDEGLKMTIEERYDNPSLKSNFYIMFGRLEAIVKSASGTGIVSSVFLQSDDLDEIDIEWFGGDGYEVQSNFFSKGDTTTYDRGGYHSMSGDPRLDFHNYTLEWTKDSLTWYVDGVNVRVLASDDSQGYPQSPSAVFLGLWAGGDPGNEQGTIDWAGGETDYTQAPFSMYVQKLVVSDYSSGEEYSFTDQSGDWTSVEAKNGKVNGRIVEADKEFYALVDGGTISSASRSATSVSSSAAQSSSSNANTTKRSRSSASSKTRADSGSEDFSSTRSQPSSSPMGSSTESNKPVSTSSESTLLDSSSVAPVSFKTSITSSSTTGLSERVRESDSSSTTASASAVIPESKGSKVTIYDGRRMSTGLNSVLSMSIVSAVVLALCV